VRGTRSRRRRSPLGPAVALAVIALLALPGTALALGTAGEIDPSFHGGAPVLLDLAKTVPRRTGLSGVLVDAAGRIVVAGDATDANGNWAVALARLDSAGTLDSGFGDGGGSVVQFGAGTAPNFPYSSVTNLFAIPGRYVGVGVFRRRQGRSDLSAYVVGQNGRGDLGFGNAGAGFSTIDPFPAPYETTTSGVAAGPDGSILMAGTLFNSTDPYVLNMEEGLDPQGVHQPDNAANGIYLGRAGYDNSYGGPVTILPSGMTLLTGSAELASASGFGLALARLAPNGIIDSSFGDGEGLAGSTVVNVSDPLVSRPEASARAVAVAPNGAIYLAGDALDGGGDRAALIARFTPSGRLDYSFGSGGFRRIQLGGPEESSSIASIVLQPDGKVVTIADVDNRLGNSSPRILRFDEDGSLDPTFGDGGQVVVNLGGTESSLSSATIQDGQLLVAGSHSEGSVTYGVVTRYLLGPLPDPPPAATGLGPGSSSSASAPAGGKASGSAGVGSLRISAKSLRVDHKGRVSLPFSCSAAGPCAGKVAIVAAKGKLTGPRAKRAATYAQAAYALGPGATKTVTLTLSKATRARAKAGLKARLAIEPQGGTATLSPLKLHR
jgi:uncharacterized delta-60 repeat protein